MQPDDQEWPFVRLPYHEHAQELVNLISAPGVLEGSTLAEVHSLLHNNGFRPVPSGSVTMGWGNQKTGAMLLTRDRKGIVIDAGPDGTYAIGVLFENSDNVSQSEIEQWRQYEKHFPGFLRSFHRGSGFAGFLYSVIHKQPMTGNVSKEHGKSPHTQGGHAGALAQSFQDLLHPHAVQALDLVASPEFLEGKTFEEIREILEGEYGFALAKDNRNKGVIMEWGSSAGLPGLKTGAGLVTNDKNALLLAIGHDGTYVAQILASDDGRPTRHEEREVQALLNHNVFQYYELTESFRHFLDRVRTRLDVRGEHPITEWIARVREKVTLLLWRLRGF